MDVSFEQRIYIYIYIYKRIILEIACIIRSYDVQAFGRNRRFDLNCERKKFLRNLSSTILYFRYI